MLERRSAMEPSPFKLNFSLKDPLLQKSFLLMQGVVERCFLLDKLNSLYNNIGQIEGDQPYVEKILQAMNVRYEVDAQDFCRIPVTGPAIVVANHPFGGIEGVILAAILRAVRSDARIMANYLLARITELKDYFIFVDPFGTERSASSNIKPMKDCLGWLRQGGMLGIFPAGEVAHIDLHKRAIQDPEWNPNLARLIRRTEAPVIPIYFEGNNGPLFQIAGLMHPRLRTAMLPREFLNKKDSVLKVRVGQPIPFERMERFTNDDEFMNYLRLRTYILANRHAPRKTTRRRLPPLRLKTAQKPIEEFRGVEGLLRDIEGLPAEQELLASEEYKVYFARAAQIPNVLHEIGRLREITFRQVNEGTGEKLDLDRFDKHYLHLFVWNPARQELVGAYRMGQTDIILRQSGMKGLYTSTLFKYRKRLMDQLNPALELGRSFIRPEYQRNYSALLLLWKGIGAYVARHPRYTNLFGPVSINNEYHSTSRQLLVQFLQHNRSDPGLSQLIKPRKPLKNKKIRLCDRDLLQKVVTDVDEVTELIGEIEKDQKGIPILLKQYLKLGGKLLAFNIDPDFSYVLDGLIWVDLLKTDHKTMHKYMGKEGCSRFMEYHGRVQPAAKAAAS
jgi:putative hemolysin